MCATIYDIARKAHVSIATVSRVFNNHPRVSLQTRQRVLTVAGELGYQPHASAQSLARRKSHLVSAVIPMLTNDLFIEVMRGLQDRLAESAYDLLVFSAPTPADAEAQLERALQKGLTAGVLLLATPLSKKLAARLARSEPPVVLVDAFDPAFDTVSVDNRQGGYLAAQHLALLGYRRIALVLPDPATAAAAERRSGFEAALREAGLCVEASLGVPSPEGPHDAPMEEAGYRAMLVLLHRSPRPDAVFVASDAQAQGALRALQEAGLRVPEDLALIGFDDLRSSRYVGLSTLRQPTYEMGRLAMEKLLDRIAQPERPITHTVFSPSLVCRSTCGTPAQHAALGAPLPAQP